MRNLKRVLSLALALVMVLGMMVITTSAATFTDDAEIEYKEAIAVMNGIGLFQGNPDGSVAPKEVLTRAMAATILARVNLGNKVDTLKATQQIFTDVPVNYWAAEEIQYCYNTGLIAGNGDGTFAPDAKLTGIAFAKLLLVALGYDADEQGYVGKDWASNIAVDALANNLYIEGVDIAEELTREQAAQMILQVLHQDTVYYLNSFDKATGEAVIVGPLAGAKDFKETYYEGLIQTGKGHESKWGRPYWYKWTYSPVWYDGDVDTLWTEWEEAKAVYTTAVKECEVASEIGMSYGVDLTWSFTTFTNGHRATKLNNQGETVDAMTYIDAIDTVNTIGAQGRLTEVYSRTIVYVDTFLAKVTAVKNATFDAAGHQATRASRTIEYYGKDAQGNPTVHSFTETNNNNFDNKVGQWLLINVTTKGVGNDAVQMNSGNYAPKALIVSEPQTLTGAQTILWGNESKHTVAGTTYNDAVKYSKDDAGNIPQKQFTWFFDSYGNLIGSANIAATPDTYATIADIQWYNPASVSGYAWATLVYADGTTEQVMVSAINGKPLSYTWFEGKYADGSVSMNYAYNTEYIGKALFSVTKVGNGVVVLNELQTKATGVAVTKGNPIMFAAMGGYLDDNTQFLVRTTVAGKFVYTPVTGYNQIASLTNATVYYVNLDADWAAEIVYMYGAPKTSTSSNLYYCANTSYSWAAGDTEFVTLQGTTVNGVVTPVTINRERFDGIAPDVFQGEMYYMVDVNGDGKVDTRAGEQCTEIGATPVELGANSNVFAVKITNGNYAKLNNALQVVGTSVPYNITNATVYGEWVGAGDIVVVYTGVNVSAIYVL